MTWTMSVHHAALGSVPRSIEGSDSGQQQQHFRLSEHAGCQPRCRCSNAFVYAASSSTYGDHPELPKEGIIGKPLSSYAVTKYVNVNSTPTSLHAAMEQNPRLLFRRLSARGRSQWRMPPIPLWVAALIKDESLYIRGT